MTHLQETTTMRRFAAISLLVLSLAACSSTPPVATPVATPTAVPSTGTPVASVAPGVGLVDGFPDALVPANATLVSSSIVGGWLMAIFSSASPVDLATSVNAMTAGVPGVNVAFVDGNAIISVDPGAYAQPDAVLTHGDIPSVINPLYAKFVSEVGTATSVTATFLTDRPFARSVDDYKVRLPESTFTSKTNGAVVTLTISTVQSDDETPGGSATATFTAATDSTTTIEVAWTR